MNCNRKFPGNLLKNYKKMIIIKAGVRVISMTDLELLYEVVTFIAVVLLFDFAERYRPAFPVQRKYELNINVLAMTVVIFAGQQWKNLLRNWFDAFNTGEILSGTYFRILPSAAKILFAIILSDFCLYWVHWAMHRRMLWRTHSFHHSIGQIWWLSGSRTSLTHLFLFAVPQIFIGYYLLDFSVLEAGITFSFGVIVNLWIHTNLWVNLGPLEWLLITPNYHRIHHGAKGLMNKNLAFVFTVWDRMFGTYVSTETTGRDFPLFPAPTQKRLMRMILGI